MNGVKVSGEIMGVIPGPIIIRARVVKGQWYEEKVHETCWSLQVPAQVVDGRSRGGYASAGVGQVEDTCGHNHYSSSRYNGTINSTQLVMLQNARECQMHMLKSCG